MGLINNLKGIFNNKNPTEKDGWLSLEADDLIKAMRNHSDPTDPEGAEKLSAVAAAHRILTNSIASLPFIIRQKQGEKRMEADHKIGDILKNRPNRRMTPFMLKKVIASQAFWYGTGYCYVGYDNIGNVSELIPLPSAGCSKYMDSKNNVLWYSFSTNPNDPTDFASKRKFSEDELIIYHFESHDGYVGRGFLEIAKKAISADNMAQEYNRAFYKNGARVAGIIKVQGELEEDKRKLVRDDFERMASGMSNAFRVGVLDLGMEYTPLGVTQQDAQFLEARTFSVSEVSRFSGVPLYMMQEGKQSYQSNEQQQLDFFINTLTPHIVQIEQEFTYKLLSDADRKNGYYIKLNEAALLRGDNKARAEYYKEMIGLGTYCQDEVRELEDKSPLPNGLGQNYWMSKNYDTIENMKKGDG